MYGNPNWNFPPTDWDRKTVLDYTLMESRHESVMFVRDRAMAGEMDDMPMTQVVAYTRQKLKDQETIVAAALRVPVPAEYLVETWRGSRVYPDHLIVSAPPPARHGTLLHPLHTLGIRVGPDDQGFVTSTGRFVEREEALKIVLAAGQPFRDVSPYKDHGGTQLFSEDLW